MVVYMSIIIILRRLRQENCQKENSEFLRTQSSEKKYTCYIHLRTVEGVPKLHQYYQSLVWKKKFCIM